MAELKPWSAPLAPAPITATVRVPGSKSETNRALVLAALSSGPSTISNGLEARDTRLMRDALRALGVEIIETGHQWQVTPPAEFAAGGTVDCGLAGTVMRFIPPVAALAAGTVSFDGDEQSYGRPMGAILGALSAIGARIEDDATHLPFTLHGGPTVRGGAVTIDASESSQFVSGLLLAGARYPEGLDLRHVGPPVPSLPHVGMTVAMLRARGVSVDDSEPDRWVVAPGPVTPVDIVIEPDLSNAAPFLAAAALTGGTVTIPDWPSRTHQPGDEIRRILQRFGARVALHDGDLVVQGTNEIHGIDLNLHGAGELTPVVAAVAALSEETSHLHGVAHLRGHETDRLAALETELNRLGGHASQTEDGLTIHPRLLGGDLWHTYADHRMAQAGAVIGLIIPDVVLDDIGCTSKTMPEFEQLWTTMIDDAAAVSEADEA